MNDKKIYNDPLDDDVVKTCLARERIFEIVTPSVAKIDVLVCFTEKDILKRGLLIAGVNGKICHLCHQSVIISPQSQSALLRGDIKGMIICKDCFVEKGGNIADIKTLFESFHSGLSISFASQLYDESLYED